MSLTHAPMEDLVTPFMLEGGHVRGRVVRLGETANTVLSRYDYPPHVVRMLGELLAVAAMLSANLKSEGVFTIQIRGNGLIPLMVVDAVYGGAVRGYAEVSPESEATIRALAEYSPRALVGEGAYLAITLDPGAAGQRYQGIVGLEGDSVAEALTNYFTHSEQLDVEVRLAVHAEAPYSASGLMIERLPEPTGASEANLEAWRYAKAMTATVKTEELLDPLLDAQTLLYRLYHEEGVIMYAGKLLTVGCRCSRQRILDLLMSMSATDRADMIVDGVASVHCQFCNKSELFTPQQLGIASNQ